LRSSEIRKAYLDYFEKRHHVIVPSASLIPKDDPTLLFTTAGMVQFKPYYSGRLKPPYPRAVSVQKCLRLSDLEEVGPSPFHDTFFEMLGNFSFGDYFKEEAIEWGWDFLVNVLGIDPEPLWVSVHVDDDDAADIWENKMSFPPERIVRLDEDNFWGPAGETGACGPCSEMHIDLGEEMGCSKPDCKPGCDCYRFFEVWNLVFPQFYQKKDGSREPLANRGIDTGMGLERISMIMQDKRSIYDTDLFRPIVDAIYSELSISETQDSRSSAHVVADHLRALVFTMAEGVLPSNEGRGYIVKRILRRAVHHGRLLGAREAFLHKLAGVVVDIMDEHHPLLKERLGTIQLAVRSEEERFGRTLDQGLERFEKLIESALADGSRAIPGPDAFTLHDTYGFPIEMTAELARERDVSVDVSGFEKEMEAQRSRARGTSEMTSEETGAMVDTGGWEEVGGGGGTEFVGYDRLKAEARPLRLRELETPDGRVFEIVYDVTPFYAEAGGQTYDSGKITAGAATMEVEYVKWAADEVVHGGRLISGDVSDLKKEAVLEVDAAKRLATERNHTATHLLHAALRSVLGDHVRQAGSYVGPDRLRFDFVHFSQVTEEEKSEVSRIVNSAVMSDIQVCSSEMDFDEATGKGAMALFEESYGEKVRVMEIGDMSIELCGGTHLDRTGQIGLFVIVSEESVSSGVRRIEALTGNGALDLVNRRFSLLRDLSGLVKSTEDELYSRVEGLTDRVSRLEKAVEELSLTDSYQKIEKKLGEMPAVDGVVVISMIFDVPKADMLKSLADYAREKSDMVITLLGAMIGGKATVVLSASDTVIKKKSFHSGKALSSILSEFGGKGGGKPHMAQGGIKDSSRLKSLIEQGAERIGSLLSEGD
jgi:alanyl-tRNA synthetase